MGNCFHLQNNPDPFFGARDFPDAYRDHHKKKVILLGTGYYLINHYIISNKMNHILHHIQNQQEKQRFLIN